MIRGLALAVWVAAAFAEAPQARAQSLDGGVEVTSAEVRGGIGWSGGQASASADARLDLGAVDASLRLAILRGARRHGGADIVADVALGRDWQLGAVTFRTEAIGHIFANATERMDYGEFALGARYDIGPLRIGASTWYAPRQGAIGGDNLHLRATFDAGVPGLPITVHGGLGYTAGHGAGQRAARLRPDGDFTDWTIGAEYVRFPMTFGLDYAGNDIRGPERSVTSPFAELEDAGDRIVVRIRLSM